MTVKFRLLESDEEEARAYLAAIIDSSDDAIISKDLDGIIRTWNNSATRLLGYTPEEAIGSHIRLIFPPGKADEAAAIIGRIKQGEKVDHFETVRQAKNGDLIDISLTVSPIRDAEGKVVGASKVARDIRDSRMADRANAYLASIVDSSDDAIISKNLDGIITSWNKSAQRMFGHTPEEAIGKHITLIIPPHMIDEEYSIIGRVKKGERIDHFQTRRRTKQGNLIDISLTVSPIVDRNGTIVGASKVARDITDQNRMTRELADAAMRKDKFLANISHELRTPMNAVLGLAGILSASPALPARERTYIETLKGSAENLLALINNLLDFSRMDTDGFTCEKIEFNLPEVIERTIGLLKVKADSKALPIQLVYDTPVHRYYIGDPLRLQQILTNFIDNAIKFTETGRIDIHVRVERDALKFSIADTGIGIAEDKIGLMFEKFTQADASTTRKYGGSGLGLSIAKKLIEKMGGSLLVKSKLGFGTRFSFVLPLPPSEQVAMQAASSLEGPNRDVLVVDDYEANLLVMSALLDQFGYSYDMARDGSEALRKFSAGTYKVILMDVQMHGIDGFESTRKIRDLELSAGKERTPVIGVTAHVSQMDRDNCLKAGMDDFLPKPFPISELEEKIRNYIG